MLVNHEMLLAFITESNAIEGIDRRPTDVEVAAHVAFLSRASPTVEDIEAFVTELLSQYWLGSDPMPSPLRASTGMDIHLGLHRPPLGGPHVRDELTHILQVASADVSVAGAYRTHIAYETLHPFIDGNGRSGRVLWAWQTRRGGRDPFELPFLQRWYYDSLDVGRH
jgi:Fic family protein